MRVLGLQVDLDLDSDSAIYYTTGQLILLLDASLFLAKR